VLDVRELSDVTDYLVIATGESRRQLRAIQNTLCDELQQRGSYRPRVEGEEGTSWILLDCADAVIHLFDPEARVFYDLELLWGDAPKVNWQAKSPQR
jgi:ribosome-associated protein